MATCVVNIQHGPCDVYVGRGSPFGNPYAMGIDGDRAEVIRLFTAYFHERLKRDPAWKAKVDALKGKKLGCHCAFHDGFHGELRCHGQVIAGYLEGVAAERITS